MQNKSLLLLFFIAVCGFYPGKVRCATQSKKIRLSPLRTRSNRCALILLTTPKLCTDIVVDQIAVRYLTRFWDHSWRSADFTAIW